jgi:general secretion pathway protein A
LYQEFYGLKENPFRLSPDPSFMCMIDQHQEALSGLIYSVCTRPGLTVLVGEAGTGKTTLLYTLLEMLEKRGFITAMCTNPTLTRQEFYDLVLMKFGVECASLLKSRQLGALEESLRRNRTDGRPSVLIIDEAQRLSTELLEEVRLLLNLETPREKLLEIIVAGQPELSEILQRPELRQLKQRVSCICRLKPLTLEDLAEYLHHRVTRAGLPTQSLFAGDGMIELILEYTDGIPRLVNSLCDSALRTGFALRSTRITTAILEEAAKDLDLLRMVREPLDIPRRAAAATALLETPPAPPAPPTPPGNLVSAHAGNGHVVFQARVPLEAYQTRQKNLGFFSNLMERWK